MTTTVLYWLVALMIVTLWVTGIFSIIKIHRASREHQKMIDEWYERELAWLEEMMKDEDDD